MKYNRFHNPWPHEEHGFLDILKWKFGIGEVETPMFPEAGNSGAGFVPVEAGEIKMGPESGWRVMWLGHASFLIQGAGLSILVDAVFAEYCAPVRVASLRRKVATPVGIGDLPEIDLVLLTHSHYDHLDLASLRVLPGNPWFVIAEGHADWLRRKIPGRKVNEVVWGDTLEIGNGVRLTATPAQHFTARTMFDRNRGFWCGWLLEGAGCKLWHAGDSGYCPAFREIGEKYGPIDFGMIPIGAYQPRKIMKSMHMNPEEAVRAFLESRCRRAVAMHWGTFVLTDEPMQEPPLRLARELAAREMDAGNFVAGKVGENWVVSAVGEKG